MSATSQVEKLFQMHSIYKRSKRYFDVQRLNQQQHLQQLYRRKPNLSIQTLDTRVGQSFINSTNEANKRLIHDISQFKKRFQDQTQTYTNADTIVKNGLDTEQDFNKSILKTSRDKIKGPDLNKMSARKTFGQSKIVYKNEDQFNNFNLSSPRSRAQLNFSLNSPRSRSSLCQNPQKKQHQIDLNKIGKTQQKNNFNSSVYKCLFDYSKINQYGKQSKKQKTLSQLKPIKQQKLKLAQNICKVNPKPCMQQFYLSIGNQTPTQTNYRYNKFMEDYYQKVNQRKNKQDYSVKRRRQDMIQKKLHQYKQKKKVIDNKQQVCDYKFFNRQYYRNTKI